jgi:hypothetical protein
MSSSTRPLLFALAIALVAGSSNISVAQESTAPRSRDENDMARPEAMDEAEARADVHHDGHARQRDRWSLIASGGAALGASWIVNAAASSTAGLYAVARFSGDFVGDWRLAPEWRDVRRYGWIPLIGPWMQLAASPVAWDQDAWGIWWIASGLVQAAGLATLLAGIGLTIETDASDSSPDIAFSLVPYASPDSAGISSIGRF